MELHHIKQAADGGDDTLDNCIPLCLDCHAEVKAYDPHHPKGKKYSENELHLHRDKWYEKVALGLSTSIEEKPMQCDIDLYRKIKNVFDDQNLQYYLREYDLGNDFDNNVFNGLNTLYYLVDNPNFEFLDSEIEKLKRILMSNIAHFISYKATNTFITKHGTKALKVWFTEDGWTYEEQLQMSNAFNKLANDIWNSYCNLVEICRRKFKE
ncbi:HNH endonuclease [Clostridiaceae bacterium UIB06]|nr:HNH endonuclease [Clostridiaceae bacterium UIB06]